MNLLHPAAALLIAVAVGVGRLALEQVDFSYGQAWQRGVEALTAAAVVAVPLKFAPGDPPRRPWACLMLAVVLVLIARVLIFAAWSPGAINPAHPIIILANVFFVLSILGFNRVLGSSELLGERTEADRWRALAFVGLLAAGSLAALGYNAWEVAARNPPAGLGAWFGTATALISTTADALVCAGSIYLVWLVRPLVGGSLARPYLLLALSGATALVVDFVLIGAGETIQTELRSRTFFEQLGGLFGCLSYALIGLSALTQLWLLRRAGRRDGGLSLEPTRIG
jgi:hypothetical protein